MKYDETDRVLIGLVGGEIHPFHDLKHQLVEVLFVVCLNGVIEGEQRGVCLPLNTHHCV